MSVASEMDFDRYHAPHACAQFLRSITLLCEMHEQRIMAMIASRMDGTHILQESTIAKDGMEKVYGHFFERQNVFGAKEKRHITLDATMVTDIRTDVRRNLTGTPFPQEVVQQIENVL